MGCIGLGKSDLYPDQKTDEVGESATLGLLDLP